MNPKTSGQTLCHTIPSLEMSTAVASSWEYEGMVDELNPLKGKIALIFLSENSIGDFSQHLFSEPFRNQWRGFKTKPDLKNPDDFVGQLDTFFGYDFLEDTKIALHCKVIRDLDSIDDYDFNGTGAAFIFGQFVQSNGTHDAVSKIMRNMGEESMVVDFTNSRHETEQKRILISPKDMTFQTEVLFTLVLLRYLTDTGIPILTGEDDTILSSIGDDWPRMKPSDTVIDIEPVDSWFLYEADVGLQFRKRLRDLKDSQTRIINKFEKEYLPSEYDIRNEARSQFEYWLQSHVAELDAMLEKPLPRQEESMRKLASIWFTISLKLDRKNETHWDGVMKATYDANYVSKPWDEVKEELQKKYSENRRNFYGHRMVNSAEDLFKIAQFGDWMDEEKATFLYNYSPCFWPHFEDLYLLHTALHHNEGTEARTLEQKAWVEPTKFAKFNKLPQHSKIRCKFREFKNAGGWLQ
jgi:hypothetical protein